MNKYNFQVGDYCRHANGTIAIVAKVEKDRGFACKIGNSEYLWSYNNRFEPIPLTEEILEANGFRESIEEGTYYFPDKYSDINNRGFAIETDGDGVWFITDHQLMPFRYVHELQRVLRCCGLTDLADNFKLD